MVDPAILTRLRDRQVRHCLIGATALAAHGYARFTADVDILADDRRVLEKSFWEGIPAPEIRVGDIDDPVPGVVRWLGVDETDVILLEGRVPRLALETAVEVAGFPCRVAAPLALVLLKLEAGGSMDIHDVLAFVRDQRQRDGASWLADLPEKATWMRRDGRENYARIKDDLAKP